MVDKFDMMNENCVRRLDQIITRTDRSWPGQIRRRLLTDLRGHILEVGSGTGPNLKYMEKADEVTAVEPNPVVRKVLLERVDSFPFPVRVVEGAAESLPFPGATFDAVLFSHVLCLVKDQGQALREAHRVLKPDGRLVFFEHVAAAGLRERLQRMLEPWHLRSSGGCELRRHTEDSIRAAGFEMVTLRRHFPLLNPPWVAPMIEGTARPVPSPVRQS